MSPSPATSTPRRSLGAIRSWPSPRSIGRARGARQVFWWRRTTRSGSTISTTGSPSSACWASSASSTRNGCMATSDARMDLLRSTWKDIEAYLGRSQGIIVPLGSVEQHGPNGLIGTDVICPQAIAEGIARAADALVGPAIAFGVCPFNLAFPGTISTRAATFMALIEDYVRSLARQGFERFYFLNGHGGNIGPVQAACQDLHAARSFNAQAQADRMRFRLRSWWEYPAVNRMRRELYGEWEGMHA